MESPEERKLRHIPTLRDTDFLIQRLLRVVNPFDRLYVYSHVDHISFISVGIVLFHFYLIFPYIDYLC